MGLLCRSIETPKVQLEASLVCSGNRQPNQVPAHQGSELRKAGLEGSGREETVLAVLTEGMRYRYKYL